MAQQKTRELYPRKPNEWLELISWLPLASTTKLVAYAIARYANYETGEDVRPGLCRLAHATGLSERAAGTHVTKLRDLGLLYERSHGSASGRRALASVYVLCSGEDAEQAAACEQKAWEC